MAEFVRAKAEVKAEARREGESLGLEGAELVQYMNREVDLFIAREREEAEREMAKEKAEREMAKEKAEREMAKEQADREHALRLAELEIEKERVQAERTTTPGSNLVLDSRTGQIHHSLLFPLDPFDEKLESIEVYLDRFEQIAKMYELPEDKWNLRLAHVLKGKAYEVYSKLAEEDARNYAALRAALLVKYELTASTYRKKFRAARLEKSETYSQLLERLTKYLNKWRTLGKYPDTFQGVMEMILVEQMKECMTPDLRIFVEENGATHLDRVKDLADRYLTAHREGKEPIRQKPTGQPVDDQMPREERGTAPVFPNNRRPGFSPNRNSNPTSVPSGKKRTWCEYHQTSSHSIEECQRRKSQPHSQATAKPRAFPHTVGAILNVPATGENKFIEASCEQVMVNGKMIKCLYDTGCSCAAIVNRSLVLPGDMTNETIRIQSIDRHSHPKTFPVARIKVDTPFVKGIIHAAVMDAPAFDLILGSRYFTVEELRRRYHDKMEATRVEDTPSQPELTPGTGRSHGRNQGESLQHPTGSTLNHGKGTQGHKRQPHSNPMVNKCPNPQGMHHRNLSYAAAVLRGRSSPDPPKPATAKNLVSPKCNQKNVVTDRRNTGMVSQPITRRQPELNTPKVKVTTSKHDGKLEPRHQLDETPTQAKLIHKVTVYPVNKKVVQETINVKSEGRIKVLEEKYKLMDNAFNQALILRDDEIASLTKKFRELQQANLSLREIRNEDITPPISSVRDIEKATVMSHHNVGTTVPKHTPGLNTTVTSHLQRGTTQDQSGLSENRAVHLKGEVTESQAQPVSKSEEESTSSTEVA